MGTPLHVLSGGVGGGGRDVGTPLHVLSGGVGGGGGDVGTPLHVLSGGVGGGGGDVGFLKVAAVPANLSPHTLYGIRHIQYMSTD